MADQNILYVQTSNAPERQYSPLVLAQSAKAMGIDAAVYYLGMGLTVLKPGAAEEMKAGSFPTDVPAADRARLDASDKK